MANQVNYRILAPHFTAGGTVGKSAAPIIRYMKRWSIEQIKAHCKFKQWKLEIEGETNAPTDSNGT